MNTIRQATALKSPAPVSPPSESTHTHALTETLHNVRELLLQRGAEPVQMSAFVDSYLRQLPGDTLLEVGESLLAPLIERQWNHINEPNRPPTVVRAFNPLPFQGNVTTHSVLELICVDQPYVVDSLRILFANEGISIHRLLHPVIDTQCLTTPIPPDAQALALIYLEFDRQPEALLQLLEKRVAQMITELTLVTSQTDEMRNEAKQAAREMRESDEPSGGETADFLHWLLYDSFIFLGVEKLTIGAGADRESADRAFGLCKLRDRGVSIGGQAERDAIVQAAFNAPNRLVVTKLTVRSPIHRGNFLDVVVAVTSRSEDQIEAIAVVGLFAGAAYHQSASSVPLLRKKLERIHSASGYPPKSHAARSISATLEGYPRHLLFQTSERELLLSAQSVLNLETHPRTRLLVYPDPFSRFLSCVVYLPRDGFNTDVRLRIAQELEQAFLASVAEFTVELDQTALVRLHFTLTLEPGSKRESALHMVEERIHRLVRGWVDLFEEQTLTLYGEEQGSLLNRRYERAFRADYREHYPPEVAAYELTYLERARDSGVAFALADLTNNETDAWRVKLYLRDNPACLSDAMPLLENLGVVVEQERQTTLRLADGPTLYIHDFGVRAKLPARRGLDDFAKRFEACFLATWQGDAENDGFNRLILATGLDAEAIALIRAYFRYGRQIGWPFSQRYVEETLAENPSVVQALIDLFAERFDPRPLGPAGERQDRVETRIKSVHQLLERVTSLDHDRILRGFLDLVRATTRTSFYQPRAIAEPKVLAFKFDPSAIRDLPKPVPQYEMFVYSRVVEGVHLRGGPIARGGIRYSDRPEDFRTEILGLMKAQMVKNSVIVPVGAKGGFIVKTPASPNADDVKGAYRSFIRAMLELTDNVIADDVISPVGIIIYDEPDPYFVVAADKGTATFSDDANHVARAMGFWLGDAFASGGSAGYDHKAMGITARGAWESVKRHFRELGKDTQSEPFTAVGIGDMGGDVFGNGMLLSPHLKLVAAFNHQHIFIDPDPDPTTSFGERERLFNAARKGGWENYNRDLLSDGGAIYARASKSIELSDQAQRRLGITRSHLNPNELIRAILCAPVDLLWNGGIGTYVKASAEPNIAVGDRSNDELRVDGNAIRAQVVGEGGNLGFTQRGRIEFALNGGHIYTDAVDNAGGVDCSDHEVNIKILLESIAGNLTGDRDALLAHMTDAVAEHVLQHNYRQTQALSLAGTEAMSLHSAYLRQLDTLERDAGLDRELEALPNRELALERGSLTRPELSVLASYTKNWLAHYLTTNLEPQSFHEQYLRDYFPKDLTELAGERLANHRLGHQIVCTELANEVVDIAGLTFVHRLADDTAAKIEDIVISFVHSMEIFGIAHRWQAVNRLDNTVSDHDQQTMLFELRKLVERGTRWFLPHPDTASTQTSTAALATAVDDVRRLLTERAGLESDTYRLPGAPLTAQLTQAGVPSTLITDIALADQEWLALDIADIAERTGHSIAATTSVYFALSERLSIDYFQNHVGALARSTHWESRARTALRDTLIETQRELVISVLSDARGPTDPAAVVSEWMDINEREFARYQRTVADFRAIDSPDYPMLTAAISEFRRLCVRTKGR
ncbi:MAG: NAD-glutamate dehydrogenase [Pseudomonadota bacterium]